MACSGLGCALLYRRLPHAPQMAEKPHAPLGPSRGVVYKLAALFSLDAFAGGFVVQSLMALWLFKRFDLSISAAGVFFFCAGTLSAFSYPVAAWLARRIGLVNTMVFTHIPSSMFLILAAFSSNLYLTLGLLLLRSALSQMDVPTRTSYVMAVVTPAERATAAERHRGAAQPGIVDQPDLCRRVVDSAFPGLPLILCGALKIVYDIALLYSFRHIKPPEEASPRTHQNNRRRTDMKWITREHVKVDRVACPWLIKKFVDKDAEFIFAPADKVMDEAKRLGAIPYDVKGVELGHHGKECSFEAILKKYRLTSDPRSCCWARSSMAPIPTIRFIGSRKGRGWKRSPRASAISASRTTTRSMRPSGSSTMRSMPTARKWCGWESRMGCLRNDDRQMK